MSTNTTAIPQISIVGVYIAGTAAFLSVIISSFVSLMVLVITYITPALHSPTNLLVSHTCLCTLFYSIISTINNFIFFFEPKSTDWSCRIRAYLFYISISLVIYSYLIQAISRLFWTVLYRYRFLLTNKCHIYLIISDVCVSILIPLSSIITKDIIFRPFGLCLVPIQYKIHLFYLLTVGYIVPLLAVIILYAIIYRHIIRSTANFRQSSHGTKRDSELARNILILVSIFLFGGVPTVIYIITSGKIGSASTVILLIAATAPSVSVAWEKIMTIILNKDIRKAMKQRWIAYIPSFLSSSTRVQPFTGVNSVNTRVNRTVSRMIPITPIEKIQRNEPDLPLSP